MVDYNNIMLSKDFLIDKNTPGKYYITKKYYTLCITITNVNDKIINISSDIIFNNTNKKGLCLNIRKTKFTQLIDKFICQSVPQNLFYHCEMYCPNCEDKIDLYINEPFIQNLEGVIGIHSIEFGKCLLVNNFQNSVSIINMLKNNKYCSQCYVMLMYNGTDVST